MMRQFGDVIRTSCLLLLTSTFVLCHITRLPQCKYHAVFSITKKNHYYSSNAPITHDLKTRKQCAMLCIAKDDCLFINHNGAQEKCELLTSDEGTLTSSNGWDFISTDYSDETKIGPICEKTFPCAQDEGCKDQCDPPGFKCYPSINMAPQGTATASSSWPGNYLPELSIDENEATQSHTAPPSGPVWWELDLHKPYKVTKMEIKGGNQVANFNQCTLKSSMDKVSFETISRLHTHHNYQIYETSVEAQYVRIDGPTCQYVTMYEIKVYAITF